MSEKSVERQQAGSSDGKNEASGSRDLAGACSGGKLVVSSAEEADDPGARGPNRKFSFTMFR